MANLLPFIPSFLKGEPGRNMLLIFFAIVGVVSFGDILLPLVVLYAAGYVGGKLATMAKQPALVGMLVAGCAVRNCLPPQVGLPLTFLSDGFRSGALGLIMLRAGLGLEIDALLGQPLRLGLLAAIPCFAEVIAVVIFAGMAFSFDWRWGTLLGFCLADVSPAVAVPLLLDLQRQGRGAKRGIPSVLMAAASLNAVVAIVGFGVALKLIFAGGDHTSPWIRSLRSIVLGFGEIAVGLFLGATSGWIFSIALESSVSDPRDIRNRRNHSSILPFRSSNTRTLTPSNSHTSLPTFIKPPPEEHDKNGQQTSNKYRFHEDIYDEDNYISTEVIVKKSAYPFAFMLSSVAAGAIVMGKYLHIYGAGALTAVILGLSVKIGASSGGSREIATLSECEKILNYWWNDVGVIALFTMLGAAIDLNEIDPTHVMYAVGLVTFALIPRALAAYICSSDDGLCDNDHDSSSSGWTHNERLFAAITWCPKATVQAALSTVALDTVVALQNAQHYEEESNTDMTSFETDRLNAHIVLTVAVVSIFWTCLPSAGLIAYLGPRLLSVDGGTNDPRYDGGMMLEVEDDDEDGDDDEAGEGDLSSIIPTVSQVTQEAIVITSSHQNNASSSSNLGVIADSSLSSLNGATSMRNDINTSVPSRTTDTMNNNTPPSSSSSPTSIVNTTPITTTPTDNKNTSQKSNVVSNAAGESDLLGLGPNVPVIPPPKNSKTQKQPSKKSSSSKPKGGRKNRGGGGGGGDLKK